MQKMKTKINIMRNLTAERNAKMKAEREEKIAEAKAKTEEANARYEAAKKK